MKAPKKAKREAKHRPEVIADKDAIITAYVEAFEAKKGVAPTLDHDADHAAAFRLAEKYGATEGSEIVRRALSDGFFALLREIAPRADKWRGKAPASRKSGIGQRSAEAQGKAGAWTPTTGRRLGGGGS